MSGYWFSDAEKFVGEWTGVATMRADIKEATREERAMPKTLVMEMVSAEENDDKGDNKNDVPMEAYLFLGSEVCR